MATVYELRTERSGAKKIELAERVANLMTLHANDDEGEDRKGSIWAERGNVDFKL